MALAQPQFEKFHNTIKLSYENNPDLNEKRDSIIKELKKSLFNLVPDWTWFNQGSYVTNTGINPLKDGFDIDIGLSFNCSPTEIPDPVELKLILSKALSKENRKVLIKNSCVTVEFIRDNLTEYHIDFAIYTNEFQRVYIAKGKENSPPEERVWDLTKPNRLADYINNCHSNDGVEQYYRTVCYMKRWRDKKSIKDCFPSVALTIAISEYMEPNFKVFDTHPRDILAIREFVQTILNKWVDSRLHIQSPISPFEDLMKNVTDRQMLELKRRLTTLEAHLHDAIDEPDIHEACRILKTQFGKDFPVPEKSTVSDPGNKTVGLSREKKSH